MSPSRDCLHIFNCTKIRNSENQWNAFLSRASAYDISQHFYMCQKINLPKLAWKYQWILIPVNLTEPAHFGMVFSVKGERRNILDGAQGIPTACHALTTYHLTASQQCYEAGSLAHSSETWDTQGDVKRVRGGGGSQTIQEPLINFRILPYE